MTSYFEKLTSINASSLNLQKQSKDSSSLKGSQSKQPELSNALDQIEELRELNNKLELDLKCEHDEKADLVSLKVGLENEVLNLREVNERLEFQVEQLRVEKDKIHHVLAKFREDGGGGGGGNGERSPQGLFIASSSSGTVGALGNPFGIMKKFPSLDDLSMYTNSSPSTSPTPGMIRAVTPTSIASGGPLERITEEDETLLESLVLSNSNPTTEEQSPFGNKLEEASSFHHKSPRLENLLKRITFLESENAKLLARRKFVCSKCKRRNNNGRRNQRRGLIFEDEGLELSAIDDEEDEDPEEEDVDADDGFDDEDGAVGGMALKPLPQNVSKVTNQANTLLEMQRKIIRKLEEELAVIGANEDSYRSEVFEISKMKEELSERMKGIVWLVAKNLDDKRKD